MKAEGDVTKVIEYNGQFVGSVGIARQKGWRDHLAEIGYWLGEPYWGDGIATQAVQQMTDYAVLRPKIAEALCSYSGSQYRVDESGREMWI